MQNFKLQLGSYKLINLADQGGRLGVWLSLVPTGTAFQRAGSKRLKFEVGMDGVEVKESA